MALTIEQQRAIAMANARLRLQEQPVAPAPKGVFDTLTSAVGRGARGLMAGIETRLQESNAPVSEEMAAPYGVAGTPLTRGALAPTPTTQVPREQMRSPLREERDIYTQQNPAQYRYKDVKNLSSGLGFAAETLAGSAPYMIPALVNPALGVAVTGASTSGDIIEQQRRGGKQVNVPLADIGGAAVGALDLLGVTRSARGVLGAVTREGAEAVAKKAAAKEAQFAARNFASRAIRKGIAVGGEEGITEVGQQVIQRAAGLQDLTSPEAIEEYKESFFGGMAAGNVMGGVEGFLTKQQAAQPDTAGGVDGSKPSATGNLLDRMGDVADQESRYQGPAVPLRAAPEGVGYGTLNRSLSDERRRVLSEMQDAADKQDASKYYALQDTLGKIDEAYKDPRLEAYRAQTQRAAAAEADKQPDLFGRTGESSLSPSMQQSIFAEAPAGSQGRLFGPGVDVPTQETITPTDVTPPPTAGTIPGQGDLFAGVPTAEVPSMVGISRGNIIKTLMGVDSLKGVKVSAATGQLATKLSALAKRQDFEGLAAALGNPRIGAKMRANGESWAENLRSLTESARQQEAQRPAIQEQMAREQQARLEQQAVQQRQLEVQQQQQLAQQQAMLAEQQRVMDNRFTVLESELQSNPASAAKSFMRWLGQAKGEHGPVQFMPHEKDALNRALANIGKRRDVRAVFEAQDAAQAAQTAQREQAAATRQAQVRTTVPSTAGPLAPVTPAEVGRAAPKAPPKPAAKLPAAPAPATRNVPAVLARKEGEAQPIVTPAEKKAARKPKEKPRATEKRKQPEGGVSQRVRANEERKAAEAGGGNRAEPSPKVEAKAKQGTKPEAKAETKPEVEVEAGGLTYADVIAEADTYLADDGESGLLKPAEYQKLTQLAESEALSPDDLKERLDALVDNRRSKLVESEVSRQATVEEKSQREGKVKEQAQRLIEIREGKREKLTLKPARKAQITGPSSTVDDNIAARVLQKIRDTANVKNVLRMLSTAQNDTGEVAGILLQVVPDVKIEALSDAEMRRLAIEGGTKLKPGQTVGGLYDLESDTIYINENINDPATVVHETVHALIDYHIYKRTDIGKELISIYKRFKTYSQNQYGFDNAHEFAAEVIANPDFRAYIDKLTAQGKIGNIIRQFMDAIIKMFGGKVNTDFVERVFSLAIEAGQRDVEAINAGGRVSPRIVSTGGVSQSILPESMRMTSQRWNDFTSRAVTAANTTFSFTHQLVDSLAKFAPSATRYLDVMDRKTAVRERLEQGITEVVNSFNKLDNTLRGVGDRSVNRLIEDMTRTETWGFQPDWLGDINVEFDPNSEVARRFKEQPKQAQEVIKSVFRENHKMLKELQNAVDQAIELPYQTLIAAAEKEGDAALVKQLKKELNAARGEKTELFKVNSSKPYASLQRFGNFVVVARSPEFATAVANEDRAKIKELESDPNHYFVDMYDTESEALDTARKLYATGLFEISADGRNAVKPSDDAVKLMSSGRDMMQAFQRFSEMIDGKAGVSADQANALKKMVTEMYLSTLQSTSARKAEFKRRNVSSDPLDMMRNFAVRGRAMSHYIASLQNNEELLDALNSIRREVNSSDDTLTAGKLHNELVKRHISGLNSPPPSNLAEWTKSVTATMMLAVSPSYYLQNATQPWLMSLPYMAGRFGNAKSAKALLDGYSQIAGIWKESSALEAFDISKLPEAGGLRDAVQFLADRGLIDIGMDKELGNVMSSSGNFATAGLQKIAHGIRAVARKSEGINRVSTGIAAYKLARADGMSETDARNYAADVIRTTHGTYDAFNSPRFMRGNIGSTLTQFRKFQIVQATMLVKLFNQSFRDMDISPTERAIARRAFRNVIATTALMTGIKGLPGMTAMFFAYQVLGALFGDEDEPKDAERDMRKLIGDEGLADLLLVGSPALINLDMSSRLGFGQTFSLAPYTDVTLSKDGWGAMLTAAAGPGVGGMGSRIFEGSGLIAKGDYLKGAEKFTPNGLDDAIKLYRETTQGQTDRAGRVLMQPEDMTFLEQTYKLFGLTPVSEAKRIRERGEEYKVSSFFKDRTSEVVGAYVEAKANNDTALMQDIAEQWTKLQAVKKANGFEAKGRGDLYQAARAKQRESKSIVGGVRYSSRYRAEQAAEE